MQSTFRSRLAARLATWFATAAVAGFALAAQAQPAGIDPEAKRLLKASTDFLASQNQFSVDTRSSLEVVMYSGQKLQFEHTAKQSVQRPNKLRAERAGDIVEQLFVYDGQSLTLYNPADKAYATVAAPANLEAMLDYARDKLDIVAPAGDLIYKNAYEVLMQDVLSGFVVGKGMVDGVRCHHLAFRKPFVDVQIWVEDGPMPLPRKLVITTRDMFNAPQFVVTATRWDLQPQFTPQTFSFSPPAGAKKLDFLPL